MKALKDSPGCRIMLNSVVRRASGPARGKGIQKFDFYAQARIKGLVGVGMM